MNTKLDEARERGRRARELDAAAERVRQEKEKQEREERRQEGLRRFKAEMVPKWVSNIGETLYSEVERAERRGERWYEEWFHDVYRDGVLQRWVERLPLLDKDEEALLLAGLREAFPGISFEYRIHSTGCGNNSVLRISWVP